MKEADLEEVVEAEAEQAPEDEKEESDQAQQLDEQGDVCPICLEPFPSELLDFTSKSHVFVLWEALLCELRPRSDGRSNDVLPVLSAGDADRSGRESRTNQTARRTWPAHVAPWAIFTWEVLPSRRTTHWRANCIDERPTKAT